MRYELTFNDGSSIALLEDSVIEPSNSIYVRNRLRLHVIDGNVASFVSVFDDKTKIEHMIFKAFYDEGELAYSYDLEYYTIVADVGRKLIQTVDSQTGIVSSVYHLVAILEQPTPIEREEPIPDPEAEEIISILLGGE